MEGTDIVEQVEASFTTLRQLWTDIESVEEIHGLDSQRSSQVKQQISNAYEQMRGARESLINKG